MSKKETKCSVQTSEEPIMPRPNISLIRNKQRRSEMFRQMKREQRKLKKKEKEKAKKEAAAAGKDAPPKQIPKTIENQRVKDETMVTGPDEEVLMDESQDDMATYFNRETTPKILLTTADKITGRTSRFCKELMNMIPNCTNVWRRGLDLKKIIKQAVSREYTDLIVINEDQKKPNGIVISHLPNGPTLHFKVTNVKFAKEIKRSGALSKHLPEVVLNNFGTRLGHTVARLLASLFPHDPQFHGRRVVTFHNQRDFIFVRHHRYQFKSSKKAGLQELGPRFTLKLRSIQKGTFDSKFGEYDWVHKRHEMETSRRKFFL